MPVGILPYEGMSINSIVIHLGGQRNVLCLIERPKPKYFDLGYSFLHTNSPFTTVDILGLREFQVRANDLPSLHGGRVPNEDTFYWMRRALTFPKRDDQ